MSGLFTIFLPLLLKLLEYFVNKSKLSDQEKRTFLEHIKAASSISRDSVRLRDEAKKNRKDLERDD